MRNLCSYCCSVSLAEIKSLLGDKAGFLLRKKFGVGLNNAELIGDRFCSGSCVPRQQNGFDVHVAESLYRSSSARTRSVSDQNRTIVMNEVFLSAVSRSGSMRRPLSDMNDPETYIVVPTHRLRDVSETIHEYDEHFWWNGHSPQMIVFDDPTNAYAAHYCSHHSKNTDRRCLFPTRKRRSREIPRWSSNLGYYEIIFTFIGRKKSRALSSSRVGIGPTSV